MTEFQTDFDRMAARALDRQQPAIRRLLALMACLRDPQRGCPWDLQQDFASIAPYMLEEAYEVVAAIEAGDRGSLAGELGDLLLQVVYHAQLASEENSFDFAAVAADVTEKMIARHPHVFGDEQVGDAGAMRQKWEQLKAAERARAAMAHGRQPSRLDNLPLALPALTRAYKLQNRAARSGFDWPDSQATAAKLDEEIEELRRALSAVSAQPSEEIDRALRDELGDVLFSAANLARKLGIDPEGVLRQANNKFERRFRGLEAAVEAQGETLEDLDLATLERYWQHSKASDDAQR